MKRELLHPSCFTLPKGVTANTDPMELAEIHATGEGVKHLHGFLREAKQCDHCGGDMEKGASVVAQSIFTNRAPWYEWESEYLEPRTQATRAEVR